MDIKQTCLYAICSGVFFEAVKMIILDDTFLFYAQNTDCGYMLELPHYGGYNEYPQYMF